MFLHFKRLSEHAQAPKRGTSKSIGYDLATPIEITVKPFSVERIPLDISVTLPENCYGRLVERSSIGSLGLTTAGGVIDPDYKGNIHVILINHTKEPITVIKGQRICQLILERAEIFPVYEEKSPFSQGCETVFEEPNKQRRNKGFGSTGL